MGKKPRNHNFEFRKPFGTKNGILNGCLNKSG